MKDKNILFEKAAEVRKKAYAPYSNFFVGSCIETDTGNLYTGCNVENASYGLAVCAESNTIAAMIAAGDRKIKQISVVVEGPKVSAPCGACRQRIYEFCMPETLVHFCDAQGARETYKMKDLLVHAFGPQDLAIIADS